MVHRRQASNHDIAGKPTFLGLTNREHRCWGELQLPHSGARHRSQRWQESAFEGARDPVLQVRRRKDSIWSRYSSTGRLFWHGWHFALFVVRGTRKRRIAFTALDELVPPDAEHGPADLAPHTTGRRCSTSSKIAGVAKAQALLGGVSWSGDETCKTCWTRCCVRPRRSPGRLLLDSSGAPSGRRHLAGCSHRLGKRRGGVLSGEPW
jgi:hypothetical protein